ncbi:SRPBCC family protein [Roseovarius sp. SYSU LYC5161]|uniref:SRPBCC family protein n=1 Tax=Roseovarius halophilus (ex Wu et al. 2025) TaxID=3376060 RepID=UPI00399A7C7B
MMQFGTREDIAAPVDHVFAELSDFHAFERSALRRGADVQRVDTLKAVGPGMAWDISFRLRGKQRKIKMELSAYEPPTRMVFSSRSTSMGGTMTVDLVALSRGRTRMALDIELVPKTLSAKLLVQSLKLARGNLRKRFRLRVADFANDIEDRYKGAVGDMR